TYSFDVGGQLIAASDPTAAYSFGYDPAGRLISTDRASDGNLPQVRFEYVYDAVSNLLGRSETIAGVTAAVTSYAYDSLNRATQIVQSGTGVAAKRIEMQYDAASQPARLSRFADLAATQLVAASDYAFDNAGRLVGLE